MSALGDALQGAQSVSVPVTTPKAIQAAREALEPHEQALLDELLLSDAGGDWISHVLTTQGFPISVSQVNLYRRRLRRQESAS